MDVWSVLTLGGALVLLISSTSFLVICLARRVRDPFVWACTLLAWLVTVATGLIGPLR
jgi:hypothetical protein